MVTDIRKRFSVDEYHRLLDLGFFTEDDRVELIWGDITEMPPKRTPHSVCNSLLWKQLFRLIGEKAEIRVQEPIVLSSNSEPEPDVVIAGKKDDNYLSSHPTASDVLLVIEIADTTLKYDREMKLSLYAESGINDYWIFNLIDNVLETYSQPLQDNRGNFSYRLKRVFLPNEAVNIPSFPDLSLNLSLVFPQ